MRKNLLILGLCIPLFLACGSLTPNMPATHTAVSRLWTLTGTVPSTITSTFSPTPRPSNTPGPGKTELPTSPDEASRFHDSIGSDRISYLAPDGWSHQAMPESEFVGWLGPGKSCPSCKVTINRFSSGEMLVMSAFVSAEIEDVVLAGMPDFQMGVEGPFTTEAGVDAWEGDFAFTFRGAPAIGKLFVFCQAHTTIFAVYTRDAQDDGMQDDIIVASMKSFQFDA